ncbi:hypothetical protein DsansV1_C17g0143641 [Dioscorea sansibarensis]
MGLLLWNLQTAQEKSHPTAVNPTRHQHRQQARQVLSRYIGGKAKDGNGARGKKKLALSTANAQERDKKVVQW